MKTLSGVNGIMWECIVNGICASRMILFPIRNFLLKLGKIEIGKNSAIHSGCYISGQKLKLGNASYINRNCLIDANHAQIVIGDNVGVGYGSIFLTTCHDYNNPDKRTGNVYGKPIVIKDGVWVGGGY